MELFVDYREDALISHMSKVHAQSKNLELGDVNICLDGKTHIIIERKTIADLAQSVKDNRYKEQKLRLLSFRSDCIQTHTVKIVYILEGYYNFSDDFACKNMKNNILMSCIINSMLRDGIFIMFTKNVQDTADFITGVAERFARNPSDYTSQPHNNSDYAACVTSAVKTKKRENIDSETCFLMQLSCIPGISTKKAKEIASTLGVNNMLTLINLVEKEGKNAFSKVNGIGKVLQSQIMSYICPPPNVT